MFWVMVDIGVYGNEGLNFEELEVQTGGTCSGLWVHTLAKEELEVNPASDKGQELGTKKAYCLRERAESSRDIKSERT